MKTPQQILDEATVPVNCSLYSQLKLEVDKEVVEKEKPNKNGFSRLDTSKLVKDLREKLLISESDCDVKEKTMDCDDMCASTTNEEFDEDDVKDYSFDFPGAKTFNKRVLKNIEKLKADKEVVEKERPNKNGFCRLDTNKLVKDLREKLSNSESEE